MNIKLSIFLLISFCSNLLTAQQRVLHYTETSGYDHQTRANSFAMFQQFASASNFTLVNDTDGSEFDSLQNLLQFDLIIFSNTSGDAILDSSQRSHFEQYIQNGGALLGIHAATDTYRHSTANGNRTGTWDFYAETIGGSVQENPNHVSGTPNYNISTIANSSILSGIPNPWSKNEEYYYWENGFLDSNNLILLKVEQTLGPNGLINSYDSSRAVAWFKTTNSNSRIFYTSLGHSNSNYTADTLFQQLISNATLWCLQTTTSLEEPLLENSFTLYPNPMKNHFSLVGLSSVNQIEIYSAQGKKVKNVLVQTADDIVVNVGDFSSGIYFVSFRNNQRVITKKIIVE